MLLVSRLTLSGSSLGSEGSHGLGSTLARTGTRATQDSVQARRGTLHSSRLLNWSLRDGRGLISVLRDLRDLLSTSARLR